MNTRLAYLVLSACLAWPLQADEVMAEQTLLVTGDARDPKSEVPLYREEHRITLTTHAVVYRKPDGDLFAEKTFDYSRSTVAPVFDQVDHRFERRSGSEWRDERWVLWETSASGERQEHIVKDTRNLVIDAGFNHFIREHFDEIDQGTRIDFIFGLTNPPMELPMKLEKIACSHSHTRANDGQSLCLHARSRNFLLNWFVPDIYLVYSRDNRYLMLYEGPSNLDDDEENTRVVRIDYRYQMLSSQP